MNHTPCVAIGLSLLSQPLLADESGFFKDATASLSARNTGQGFEGRDRERDLELGYAVQGGVLKGLGIRLRNAMARSNYRSDIDENRVTLVYTWKLF